MTRHILPHQANWKNDMFANIEYLNAPTEPTRINLHIGRGVSHEVIRNIPSKAEALRICAERGVTLLSKV